ncbi:hypothetical protein H9P43_005763 [Blastocladiella emersonii ATCC 22665]|nr:hypothetical protein H9P43_005763 [Blastocladiella emersonii ATCC 22665]
MTTAATELVLLQANRAVHYAATRINYAEWGKGLTVPQYLEREDALQSSEFTRSGHVSWILTTAAAAAKYADAATGRIHAHVEVPEDLPILAACESFRRPGRLGDRDVPVWSIGSVFVSKDLRGKGYATVMMKKLRAELIKTAPEVGLSNLYSDIGPDYYARLGWKILPSTSLVCDAAATAPSTVPTGVTLLSRADVDTLLVPALYPPSSTPAADARTLFSMPLTPGVHDWFYQRAAFYYRQPGTPAAPTSQGARAGAGSFVVWHHAPHNKCLYLLHWRAASAGARDALLAAAALEAKAFDLAKVVAYLSDGQDVAGLPAGWRVEPREQSLSSLMMWRDGKVVEELEREVVWLGNERYAWV